jgi:lantibiotic transport system ATP-binding protein
LQTVLSIQNISKNYASLKALNQVSFDVPSGTVFGILGPNGSGKTTLLGIVMDVLKATEGSYTWQSNNKASDNRKQIGTLLETPNFYPYLSASNNLKIAAKIKGRGAETIDDVLKTVNLFDRRNSPFSSFSLGMKQRLAIASTLLGNPDILVFDEPTNGLDPAGIAEIRELISRLHQLGKTIIMASHILDEVEKVCTHVAIIQKGVLKTVGSVKEVMNTSNGTAAVATNIIFELCANNNDALQNVLKQMQEIVTINLVDDEVHVTGNENLSATVINKYCFENGVVLSKINVKKKSLETRFLEITGNKSDK